MTIKDPIVLSVIICTHNPRMDYLALTLASLASQSSLPQSSLAEFILIDNKSSEPLDKKIDLSPLSNYCTARVVSEPKIGLAYARLRGFKESNGDILLFVDDDNILAPDYLTHVVAAFEADDSLGMVGGKSLPRYETDPPDWFPALGISLACRDLGEAAITADWALGERRYPDCAPIGAGMAVRREVQAAYAVQLEGETKRMRLGRRGTDLASGEDNDLVLTALSLGWKVSYLPHLSLTHLIPARRLTSTYLENYVESSNRTWVQVLDIHGIRPWPPIPAWTLPLRRAKAYFANRAWTSPAARILWKKSCGLYEGQAMLEAPR